MQKLVYLTVIFVLTTSLRAQSDNYWVNQSGQYWQDATNWSLGAPNAGQTIIISVAGFSNQGVIINATTSGSYSNTMTVSNLVIDGSGPVSRLLEHEQFRHLTVPLHVLNEF